MPEQRRANATPKTDKPRGFLGELWQRLTLAAVVAAIALELATKSVSPMIGAAIADGYDRYFCGGAAARLEADRLSRQADADSASAHELFGQANQLYEKAYSCGFPDAGLRLAFAHCSGLGTPIDQTKARGLVVEIESAHPSLTGRASDVRKACNL